LKGTYDTPDSAMSNCRGRRSGHTFFDIKIYIYFDCDNQ